MERISQAKVMCNIPQGHEMTATFAIKKAGKTIVLFAHKGVED
jgi:hypothetical protein